MASFRHYMLFQASSSLSSNRQSQTFFLSDVVNARPLSILRNAPTDRPEHGLLAQALPSQLVIATDLRLSRIIRSLLGQNPVPRIVEEEWLAVLSAGDYTPSISIRTLDKCN